MKKIIAILLVLVTIFTLCVYAESQLEQADITLTETAVEGSEADVVDEIQLQNDVEQIDEEQPLVEQNGLKIYEPVFTKTGSTAAVSSLLTVQSLTITVPAKATADAHTDGVPLAVMVSLFEKNDDMEDGSFCGCFTPEEGMVTLLPGEEKDIKVTLDLSGYKPLQRKNLYVKVMLWDGYSTMKPYLVPAYEKFR